MPACQLNESGLFSLIHPSMADVEGDQENVVYVHSISHAPGRLLPSSSRWNSVELDFNLFPHPSGPQYYESLPSRFSKSVDFKLTIASKNSFKRFIYVSFAFFSLFLILCFLLRFLHPNNHRHRRTSKDLTLALKNALLFFDAQKSGVLPKDDHHKVKFRGDSGLDDGNTSLVGGFYDSGNNIKFSFPMAYTITLLSWSVIEYHKKYEDIEELDHINNIIKWGTDYLLKIIFIPPNQTSTYTLFSQVGSSTENTTLTENDVKCWQRPEDMRYKRPVSSCDETASDLAGEIIAALSAASLVFKEDKIYSTKLTKTAIQLFDIVTKEEPGFVQGTYTLKDECGGQARDFYNSTGYKDELVWGGTWLFFATGNVRYLRYASDHFLLAQQEELMTDKGILDWNNKLTATAILLTRLRFFSDLGYPYEESFISSTDNIDSLMCSYLSPTTTRKTQGGLIMLKPDDEHAAVVEYAATASFLSKLYSDYLDLLPRSGSRCLDDGTSFSVENLRDFSEFQVNYILGDNPMKMSYVVGFGNKYPMHVHHRAASIPWDNQWHSCDQGSTWLNSEDPNPNDLLGAMVRGPNQNDIFLDDRNKPWFTEPSISSNAGLVAALVALHHLSRPSSSPYGEAGPLAGIDKFGIFHNIHLNLIAN